MKPDIKDAITVERMRECDAYTIKHFVSGKTLMHRAAMGIYRSADWENKKIAIIAGSGNNGGDGYALAGILAENNIKPTIIRLSEKFSDDGRYYYDIAMSLGISDEMFDKNTDLNGYDIIVDCILGTGFSGEPRGITAESIKKINTSGAFVISADINSGLDGNTGKATLAVKSDLTVSIGYYKIGMFSGDAPKLIGNLVNIDIGIVLI